MKFTKFLRTAILKNICKWLLLGIFCVITRIHEKMHAFLLLLHINTLWYLFKNTLKTAFHWIQKYMLCKIYKTIYLSSCFCFIAFHFQIVSLLLKANITVKLISIHLRPMLPSFRNQSTDLHIELLEWFLLDREISLKLAATRCKTQRAVLW